MGLKEKIKGMLFVEELPEESQEEVRDRLIRKLETEKVELEEMEMAAVKYSRKFPGLKDAIDQLKGKKSQLLELLLEKDWDEAKKLDNKLELLDKKSMEVFKKVFSFAISEDVTSDKNREEFQKLNEEFEKTMKAYEDFLHEIDMTAQKK